MAVNIPLDIQNIKYTMSKDVRKRFLKRNRLITLYEHKLFKMGLYRTEPVVGRSSNSYTIVIGVTILIERLGHRYSNGLYTVQEMCEFPAWTFDSATQLFYIIKRIIHYWYDDFYLKPIPNDEKEKVRIQFLNYLKDCHNLYHEYEWAGSFHTPRVVIHRDIIEETFNTFVKKWLTYKH